MSRIGNKAIPIPAGVDIIVSHSSVEIKGARGKLEIEIPDLIAVDVESNIITVTRHSNDPISRSLHGLVRSLLSNSVLGVVVPWCKRLEIVGVGYNASFSNRLLTLSVGYANPVSVRIPVDVNCEVPDSTHIVLSSVNKQLVGQIAANVRAVRPPEPYKGKGIRYSEEHVRRKSGKAFGS